METDQLFLTGLIDAVPIALFCKDYSSDSGTFVCWNTQAEATWGLKKEEVIGKSDYDLFPKTQADYFKEKDLETIHSGELLYIPEEPVDSPVLGRRMVRTWKVPLNDENGPRYLLGMSLDISEQKELEKELANERLNAIHSSKLVALGEMAGGIAHEINNPLAILTMSCDIMKSHLENDSLNKEVMGATIEKIRKTTTRISKVVKGMLNVSRDSHIDKLSDCSLNEILEDVMGLSLERLKIHGIQLEKYGDKELFEKLLSCNRVQISQVFLNLLGNSFDAIADLDERWINVKAYEENKFITIEFTDSGSGIPKAIREKVFQPFFSSKGVGKGTGIGLSISKELISKHRGELTLNTKHTNTQFIIKLPLK